MTMLKLTFCGLLAMMIGYSLFYAGYNVGLKEHEQTSRSNNYYSIDKLVTESIQDDKYVDEVLETITESESKALQRSPNKYSPQKCYTDFKLQSAGKNNILGSLPWLDTNNVKLFCSLLSSQSIVLEWGCGGSTVFFSRYVKKWVCVEHVPDWGKIIANHIANQTFRDKIQVNVIEPTEFYDASIPAGSNNDGTYKQFRNYIEFPASLGETFDIILDDGRARVPAAESALSNKLLAKDGVLVIHDWERRSYHALLDRGFSVFKEDLISSRHMAVLKPNK